MLDRRTPRCDLVHVKQSGLLPPVREFQSIAAQSPNAGACAATGLGRRPRAISAEAFCCSFFVFAPKPSVAVHKWPEGLASRQTDIGQQACGRAYGV
jgi:hypothetical protein